MADNLYCEIIKGSEAEKRLENFWALHDKFRNQLREFYKKFIGPDPEKIGYLACGDYINAIHFEKEPPKNWIKDRKWAGYYRPGARLKNPELKKAFKNLRNASADDLSKCIFDCCPEFWGNFRFVHGIGFERFGERFVLSMHPLQLEEVKKLEGTIPDGLKELHVSDVYKLRSGKTKEVK